MQYSSSVQASASGTGGTHNGHTVTANPYNGTLQYNYAVKHNPMSFFTDSLGNPNNGLTFSQLQTDLTNNTYAAYNWITPNQYNDMHSALSGGFTYNGTHYTGDQAAVAQGDNFLSIIIPQIEATNAFQNGTGMIEIWFDESEGGDSSAALGQERLPCGRSSLRPTTLPDRSAGPALTKAHAAHCSSLSHGR